MDNEWTIVENKIPEKKDRPILIIPNDTKNIFNSPRNIINRNNIKIINDSPKKVENEYIKNNIHSKCKKCNKQFIRGSKYSNSYWRCKRCRTFSFIDICRLFLPI